MTRKAPTLSQIVDSLTAASEKLAASTEADTATSDITVLLHKVASELKSYNSEVTYDELNQFIKGNK